MAAGRLRGGRTERDRGAHRNEGRERRARERGGDLGAHDVPGNDSHRDIRDLVANAEWASIGVDGDTCKFALETLQRWWRETGARSHPDASRLLVSCHLDGLDDTTSRLWELGLQDVADALRMQTSVCHLPAGTSRWSNVEQQMVYRTFDDRRGRPMACREVSATLIGTVAAKAGTTVRTEHG